MRTLRLCAFLFVLGTGCTASSLQTQIRTTNGLAVGANAVLPLLESAYRAEGLQAIDAARTEREATGALVRVRDRWRPVWGLCTDDAAGPSHRCHDGAWPALVAAQDAWATALERQAAGTALDGATLDLLFRRIRVAYCDLKTALPAGVALAPAIVQGCNGPP